MRNPKEHSEYMRLWRIKNLKRSNEINTKSRNKHIEKCREYQRLAGIIYRKEHPEKCRPAQLNWLVRHPGYAAKIQRGVRSRNPEQNKIVMDRYRKKNRDIINARRRSRRANEPDIIQKHDQWRKQNKQRCLEARRKNFKKRSETEPSFRILNSLRARMIKVLKGKEKAAKTVELIGCSIENLWIYLESKFETGMTRENHGKVWHVDHIMPCAIFDMSRPDHQKACFNFSNLQPLFAADNIRKWAHVPEGMGLPI